MDPRPRSLRLGGRHQQPRRRPRRARHLTADANPLRTGIADIEAAWAYDKETGETGYDDYYRKRIEAAKLALEKIAE